jgi:hypothetical protein
MTGYRARAPRGDRPLAILGVSDVIVLEAQPAVPFRTIEVSAWGRWVREVQIPVVAAERLKELGKHLEIVWASEWGHTAHTAFREALDLPDEPWAFLPVQFNKLTAIRAYAGALPWVWIDGPLADLRQSPAGETDGLIVRLDPSRGIADVDPAELVESLAARTKIERAANSRPDRPKAAG